MKHKVIQNKILEGDLKGKEKYFLAMSNTCIQAPFVKSKLFEYFDYDIKRLFECDKNDLNAAADYFENLKIPKNFLEERDKINPDKFYDEVMNRGEKFITYDDSRYPKELKNIPDFPLMLYYKGDFEGVNFERAVAFVGSRKATSGAKEVLAKIISGLRGLDVTIVSGLAEGIDAAAHRGALENGLKTVAVIGSGFNFTYPSVNRKIYDEIESGGGVIFSEYPYLMPPTPYLFPLRNRIVTGMAFGTVVGEARLKSGAMISARLTLEYGKELMCIPGNISNPNTEGIYSLLKNGATMVTSASDILEALNWDIEPIMAEEAKLEGIEKKIYEEIALEPKNIEKLGAATGIDMGTLMVNLTSMEVKGLIKQTGGNYYISGKSL